MLRIGGISLTAIENLLLYYNQLPLKDSKRQILYHFLPHIKNIGSMTIRDFADICYTSTASVSRLIRAMGFKSYTEFQFQLKSSVQRYDYDNRFLLATRKKADMPNDMIAENLRYMVDEFQRNVDLRQTGRLVDAMHAATTVAIFSYGILFMENVLQSNLLFSGVACEIILSDQAQLEYAKNMKASDLALFICPDAVDSIVPLNNTIRTAQESGCEIAILSSTGRQPFIDAANYLYTIDGMHSIADSFALEMQLTLIDMMYRAKYIG